MARIVQEMEECLDDWYDDYDPRSEALTAATLNAACAIQRQTLIGSLEVGKKADIIIFDVPNHDFLAYHFGVNLVSKVIKKGKIIVNNN